MNARDSTIDTSIAWLLSVEEVRRPLHQLHPARGARRVRLADYGHEDRRGRNHRHDALQHRQRRSYPRHDPRDYDGQREYLFLILYIPALLLLPSGRRDCSFFGFFFLVCMGQWLKFIMGGTATSYLSRLFAIFQCTYTFQRRSVINVDMQQQKEETRGNQRRGPIV